MKGESPSSSSSAPPPFPPSSSRPLFRNYDVFLSFRGEDTRRTFTDHLYAALDRAGVRTFRDAEGLRRGGNIAQALVGAIQGCKIALIVFSERYANSRWCLDELVQIMECRRTGNQQVFPIFYHVDPSDVRNQTGSFGKAFERHEAEISSADDHRESAGILRRWSALKVAVISYLSKLSDKRHQGTERMFSEKQKELADKIARRRSALREAANLAGFNIDNRHEAEFIESIVAEIFRRLTTTYLNLAVHPVGIDSRVEDISLCLQMESDDVRIVGIWGMGGIGKTTVAKAIYNKFYHDFENKSFLGNVRETAKITLQERLLSDILKPLKIEVGHADRGIVVIKERLGSKKVLVIVDDVDDVDQLNALAISQDSFGAGSRIVITTRDRHLLDQLNVESVHIVQEMNEKEGLELFSWHAFQNPSPDEDYIELSTRLVTYSGGLPLALEVLGSFLCKRSIGEWKSALKKLEKIPHDKIQSKLRISFDTLDDSQRNIFLHVCCFFIGMDKEFVTLILKGCGFHPEREISVLTQRCLVTVNEKNKLKMHDLLRDMGREVVREESPNRPERRSRLWQQDDVQEVLTYESGTEETEGLALNLQRFEDMSFSAVAFRNMNRLKLLQLNNVQLTGDSDKFPERLIWLCLRGFSQQVIRNEFLNETYLVSIDLRYSNLVRVWEDSTRFGKLEIRNLEMLNLSHSHYLTQLPDFSPLSSLKFLILKDCVSLSKIDKSIGHLHRLYLLNLKGCIMLEDLPKEFYQLPSVRILVLSGCLRFKNLGKGIRDMFSLETLVISGTAIREVPSSVDNLPELDFSSRQGLSGLERSLEDETSGSSSLDQDTQEDEVVSVLGQRSDSWVSRRTVTWAAILACFVCLPIVMQGWKGRKRLTLENCVEAKKLMERYVEAKKLQEKWAEIQKPTRKPKTARPDPKNRPGAPS